MKNIIYAFLFLALPISMAGKDSTAIKADSPAATKAAKQEEPNTPPAPSIVKHDTVYVAVKEMPEKVFGLTIGTWGVISGIITFLALIGSVIFSVLSMRKAQNAIATSQKANEISESTLELMREQMQLTFKPQISFISRGICTVLDEDKFRFHYYGNKGSDLEDLTTKMINLGLGPAFDIEIKISANKSEFIQSYNCIKEKASDNILELKEADKGFYFKHKNIRHSWDFITVRHVDYILPAAKSDVFEEIELPTYCIYLYSLFQRYSNMLPPDFVYPTIKMDLQYRDTLNKSYHDEYKVSLNYENDLGFSIPYTLYLYMKVEKIVFK